MSPISQGDYILVQRQDYMKLHRLKEKNIVKLGANNIECSAIIGNQFLDHFKMIRKSNNSYSLEKVAATEVFSSTIDIKESGTDNRNIQDDGTSQTLSKAEIEKLRESANSQEILEKLITNSKTFDKKTEYSQEKYLKKKQKKYYDYISVRKPTIRLMANIFFKLEKTLGIRIDDLSQILTYANIQAGGRFILYDSGTNGLLPAAIMDRIGPDNDGKLIYTYPGMENQRIGLQAMGFPEEQYNRCICVNVHSVLRWYKLNKTIDEEYVLPEEQQKEFDEKNHQKSSGKRKHDEIQDDNSNPDAAVAKKPKRPNWHYLNQAACEILREGVDGLIITSKEHPLSIIQEFLDFVKPSRNFVIFSACREPLQDLYFALVNRKDVTNVKFLGNFMRHYQVLPERTHPLVNMTNGGFLLTGIKLVKI